MEKLLLSLHAMFVLRLLDKTILQLVQNPDDPRNVERCTELVEIYTEYVELCIDAGVATRENLPQLPSVEKLLNLAQDISEAEKEYLVTQLNKSFFPTAMSN